MGKIEPIGFTGLSKLNFDSFEVHLNPFDFCDLEGINLKESKCLLSK